MKEKIISLVGQGKYAEARKEIIKLNVVDIARLLEEINQQKLLIIFRILPKDLSSEVFAHIPSELQRYIVESITDEEAISILDDLFIDDAVDFLEEMPSNVVKRILKNANKKTIILIK